MNLKEIKDLNINRKTIKSKKKKSLGHGVKEVFKNKTLNEYLRIKKCQIQGHPN